MASLDDQFKAAADHFATIAATCSDQQKLTMYALWNQASTGDVDPKVRVHPRFPSSHRSIDARVCLWRT